MRVPRRARTALGSAVYVAALVVAGLPVAHGVGSDRSSRFEWSVLVPGPERFVVSTQTGGEIRIGSRLPEGQPEVAWNRRQILVRRGSRPARDATVCATWRDQSRDSNQEGLGVRVATGRSGRLRALTVTKNTYAGYYWVFNLVSWDTGRAVAPWRGLGQFDMSAVVSQDLQLLPFPWRVCLRAQGRDLGFKVWLPEREAEPSWTDPVHTGWVRVPRRFTRAGRAGWYAGHLAPGEHVTYAGLAAAPRRLTPPGRNTSYPRRHD